MRPIIIDTDPGIDDAIALWLALRSPELELLGVTAVAGNVSVERAAANAARVLALGGVVPGDLPLHVGMRGPLARPHRVDDEPGHGRDALGEAGIPAVDWPLPRQHAVEWLESQIRRRPGEITILSIGPASNVASLLQRLPDPAMIAEIIMMSGSVLAPGNVTVAAEFNAWVDPEALRVVLQSGAKVRLVGLNVTRHALLSAENAEAMAGSGPVGRAVCDLNRAFIEHYRKRHGVAACAMHDPLVVAAAVQPDLIEWRPCYVDVELSGELTRGMTVADLLGRTGRPANALVAMAVDAARLQEFLVGRLTK